MSCSEVVLGASKGSVGQLLQEVVTCVVEVIADATDGVVQQSPGSAPGPEGYPEIPDGLVFTNEWLLLDMEAVLVAVLGEVVLELLALPLGDFVTFDLLLVQVVLLDLVVVAPVPVTQKMPLGEAVAEAEWDKVEDEAQPTQDGMVNEGLPDRDAADELQAEE